MRFIKKFFRRLFRNKERDLKAALAKAEIVSRSHHTISRKTMSANALKVLYRLKHQHYAAFLVGGSVRDLLLGRTPKDFDVVTDALPNQIKRCFRNGRIIGKRFRLVHIAFKDEIVEVSTFRALSFQEDHHKHSRGHVHTADENIFGNIDEDATRRDFTINAIYYNIDDFSLVDFHHGIPDLKNRILRLIGDPVKRYKEDPVRILRAVRLAVKLKFHIEPQTEAGMIPTAYLLRNISPARMFTELLKMLSEGYAWETFSKLRHYDLLQYLLPLTDEFCKKSQTDDFFHLGLIASDQRIHAGMSIMPAFIFAVLLWPSLQRLTREYESNGTTIFEAFYSAFDQLIDIQQQSAEIPKFFINQMREIFLLQLQFQRRRVKIVFKVLEHPQFAAGYDFLLLRAKAGEAIQPVAKWWREYVTGDEAQKQELMNMLHRPRKRASKEKTKSNT